MELKDPKEVTAEEKKTAEGQAAKEEKQGLFVEIIDPDERGVLQLGESKLFYRRMDFEQYQAIRAKHKKETGKNGMGQPVYEHDETAIDRDVFSYMLTGWENVKHPVTGAFVAYSEAIKARFPNTIKNTVVSRAFSSATEHEIKN